MPKETHHMKTLLIAALALTAYSTFAAQKNTMPSCDTGKMGPVSYGDVSDFVAKKTATFVDLNDKETYDSNHIPDAIHYYSAKDTLATVLPKDKNALIVAYCGGPSCSAWKKGAKAACEMGYTNIKHYSDGIQGWKAKKPLKS